METLSIHVSETIEVLDIIPTIKRTLRKIIDFVISLFGEPESEDAEIEENQNAPPIEVNVNDGVGVEDTFGRR